MKEDLAGTIFTYILLHGYAYAIGITHAILYGRRGADSFPNDEHKYFVAGHISVCLAVFSATYIKPEDAVIVLFAFMLSFSFIHNGAYYLTRKKIDEHDVP